MIEHHARFNGDRHRVCVKGNDVAQPFTVINDQCIANGLTALTCPRTARQHRYLLISCNIKSAQYVGLIAWHDHTNWCDLIDRGIG